MNTKLNDLGFCSGLVGGRCIGVAPYCFSYEARKICYHCQIILKGRIVNDSIESYVSERAIQKMSEAGFGPKKRKAVIFRLTFKEN